MFNIGKFNSLDEHLGPINAYRNESSSNLIASLMIRCNLYMNFHDY